MFKTRGGGVKGFLNNVKKKLHFLSGKASLRRCKLRMGFCLKLNLLTLHPFQIPKIKTQNLILGMEREDTGWFNTKGVNFVSV